MSERTISLRPVAGALPAQVGELADHARAEGCGIVDRLRAEWDGDVNRFDRDGERLLVAWSGEAVAGIGGMTHDPVAPGALRMRRFYVRPADRRHGVARRLAAELIAHARALGRPVTVNAGTADAPAFWEAQGFVSDRRDGHTHILPRQEDIGEGQEQGHRP